MKFPFDLLLVAAFVTPLALQAQDAIPIDGGLSAPIADHDEPLGQPSLAQFHTTGMGTGGGGVEGEEMSVVVVPEPGLAGLLGILGAILLLRRRG